MNWILPSKGVANIFHVCINENDMKLMFDVTIDYTHVDFWSFSRFTLSGVGDYSLLFLFQRR